MKATKEKDPRIKLEEDFIKRYQENNQNGRWSDRIKLMKARLKISKQLIKLDSKDKKMEIQLRNSEVII